MASEEDKKFHAVLGGYLTSGLRSGAERLYCPEPEVLAAYHERSLSLEELSFWKSHVAGCVRCQQILAHLDTTEHLEAEVASGEKVEAMSEPAAFKEPLPIEVGQLAAACVAASAQETRSRSVVPVRAPGKRQRKTHWSWLVPAGAIAAGLLVWIAFREAKPPAVSQRKATEMAANRPTSPAPQAVQPASPPAAARAEENNTALPSKNGDSTMQRATAIRGAEKQQYSFDGKALTRSKTAPAGTLSKKTESADGLVAGLQTSENELRADTPAARKQKESDKTTAEAAALPSQPAFLENDASAASRPANRRAVASPPPSTPAPAAKAPAGGVSGDAQSVEAVSRARPAVTLHYALLGGSRMFSAPGRKSLWRLGPAGSIEFSDNSGTTWLPQTSGVTADLSAGTAVSEKVCWVVGNSGTVLRTTDGGAHWFPLSSPTTEDLSGIRATDAFHAWISVELNQQKPSRRTYRTTDGGITWTELPEP